MSYHFGTPAQVRLKITDDVRIPELAKALTGSLITISNYPGGGFIIHRLRPRADNSRPTIPCDGPPGPKAAA